MATRIGFGTLNWSSLSNLRVLDADEALIAISPFKSNYVLPQLMALLGGEGIKLQRNTEGKVSAELTLKALTPRLDAGELTFSKGQPMTKGDFIGIIRFLTYVSRKEILPAGAKQVAPEWARFSTCVPLILSAFKEFRNLKYSEWDFEDSMIDQLVDPRMLSILKLSGTEVCWDASDLLEFQSIARTVKTGASAGTARHINSTTAISKVGDEDFDKLPSLVRVLLLQTWVFQPSLATSLGVYNLLDIDAPAEPLITADVFKQKSNSKTTKLIDEVLW